MCLALYQASCPKNRSRTAHGWIPMWRKMNCEKTPSSTEQLVPANKALLKKLTRAQDERRCHRACASVPPDSSTDCLPKYMPVREDRFLRDLATPKSSLNSPVFSPPPTPPLQLLFRPPTDTVLGVPTGCSRQSVSRQRAPSIGGAFNKDFGEKVWAGRTAAPSERAVSGPSASRGLSVAWRGRPSEWLVAPGLERAVWGRLLTGRRGLHVRLGRACGEGARNQHSDLLLFSISCRGSLLAESIWKPEGGEPICIHTSQHPGTPSRWRKESGTM